MSKRLASLRLASHSALLFLLLVAGAPWPSVATGDVCDSAEPVSLNAKLLRYREQPEGVDLLQLTFPSTGVLMLHSSSPATEATQPRLAFLGDSCAGGAGYTLIRQTPAGMVLRIADQGTYFLEVSAEDPDRPLFSYKLQTAFVAEPAWPDAEIPLGMDTPASCTADGQPTFTSDSCDGSCFVELQRRGWWTKDVDQIDDDVEGGGFTDPDGTGWWTKDVDQIDDDVEGGGFADPGVVLLTADDPLQVALYAGTTCSPKDRRAEGLLGGTLVAATVHPGDYRLHLQPFGPDYTVSMKFFAVCGLGEQDDHLDMPLCSTPLTIGADAVGALDNATDDDYFTFEVTDLETMKIGVHSDEPVSVGLYDEGGQQLASRECGDGCSARVVRTLGKGRYYLRVASGGAFGGRYRVNVAVIDAQ